MELNIFSDEVSMTKKVLDGARAQLLYFTRTQSFHKNVYLFDIVVEKVRRIWAQITLSLPRSVRDKELSKSATRLVSPGTTFHCSKFWDL